MRIYQQKAPKDTKFIHSTTNQPTNPTQPIDQSKLPNKHHKKNTAVSLFNPSPKTNNQQIKGQVLQASTVVNLIQLEMKALRQIATVQPEWAQDLHLCFSQETPGGIHGRVAKQNPRGVPCYPDESTVFLHIMYWNISKYF